MANPLRVSVLISGRGSNLDALIRHAGAYTVSAVLSDTPSAPGLEIARNAGIPCVVLGREQHSSRESHRAAIMNAIEETHPDLIALAGFMRLIPEDFVERHFGRMINIHPSLLPRFPGLHTHERVLEAGEKEHGCTVHFVDSGVDTGPIIAQATCEVRDDDTVETLGTRVLRSLEHRLYPWVVTQIATGDLRLNGRDVETSTRCAEDAARCGFFLRGERTE